MSADLRHAENNSLIEPSTCVRKLPPDSIKIDGSFVRDLTINSGSRFIVKSVIYLSRDLPINIVAEGIETSEQINFLRLNDCHVRWILASGHRGAPSEALLKYYRIAFDLCLFTAT